MSDTSLPSRRAVAAPVLIVEDKPARAGEVLSEVESLGLHGRIVPSSSMYAVPGPSDRYSLVILTVRSLQPKDLADAAAVRRSAPDLPLLLLCDEKKSGAAPWPNCTVTSGQNVAKKLRILIADVVGISLAEGPGATLKE